MAAATPPGSPFNPYSQYLNLTMPDGMTQETFNISQIFYLQHLATVSGIIYGTQVGITGIFLLVLAVMTKPDKRRSIVFILNFGALIFTFVRSVLSCVEVTGGLYNFYNWITGYYVSVDSSLRVSVAAEVFETLAILFIELSLMFQVRIVCCTLRDLWRRVVDIVSIVVVIGVIAVRLTTCVLNSDWGILHLESETMAEFQTLGKLASASNIIIASSIIFFSVIFCGKLGHAILERRKLGMKRYGPMQIIFIMGCQTLVIPAIFGILAYIALKSTQINSFMPVIVATFLPLSSIWASKNTNNPRIATPPYTHQLGHHHFAHGRPVAGGSDVESGQKRLWTSTVNTGDTLINDDTNSSFKNLSGSPKVITARGSTELEMQRIGHNIQVDRTYSVHTG